MVTNHRATNALLSMQTKIRLIVQRWLHRKTSVPSRRYRNLYHLPLPQRRVTDWGILANLRVDRLDRDLMKDPKSTIQSITFECLCLESYRLIYLPELLKVRYYNYPEPLGSHLEPMTQWVNNQWLEQFGRSLRITEGEVVVQLRAIARRYRSQGL
jgi:hypothetical protein